MFPDHPSISFRVALHMPGEQPIKPRLRILQSRGGQQVRTISMTDARENHMRPRARSSFGGNRQRLHIMLPDPPSALHFIKCAFCSLSRAQRTKAPNTPLRGGQQAQCVCQKQTQIIQAAEQLRLVLQANLEGHTLTSNKVFREAKIRRVYLDSYHRDDGCRESRRFL
jgi:hypothetical protein